MKKYLLSTLLIFNALVLFSQNWSKLNSGSERDLFGIYFVSADTGWAVGATGEILHTQDGGSSWTNQNNNQVINRLNDVFFTDALNGWIVGDLGTILRTVDGGQNWLPQESPTPFNLNAIHFSVADTAWAVGEAGAVIRSVDGGDSWSNFSLSIAQSDLNDIFFTDSRNGWLVGTEGVFLRTTDRGVTWTPSSSNLQGDLQAVSFSNPSIGWVASASGDIYRSITGGLAFALQDAGTNGPLYDLSVKSTEVVWVSADNGETARTSDGGEGWDLVNIPLLTDPLFAIFFVELDLGYTCTRSGGIYKFEFVTSVQHVKQIPEVTSLILSPNPAQAFTRLDLSINEPIAAKVDLLDSQGRLIGPLWTGTLLAGDQRIQLKLGEQKSGYYFIRLQTDQGTMIRKLSIR